MDAPRPARYVSLAAELGAAPPAVLDGLEVVEEQVVVLGPLDLTAAGPARLDLGRFDAGPQPEASRRSSRRDRR